MKESEEEENLAMEEKEKRELGVAEWAMVMDSIVRRLILGALYVKPQKSQTLLSECRRATLSQWVFAIFYFIYLFLGLCS